MPFDPEAISQSGSGLVFVNYYDDTVSAAYRNAIISAERELQSHFTNPVTISVKFVLGALGPGAAAQNHFTTIGVSYSTLKFALANHVTSADDQLAVAGLPTSDPSNGAGWAIPVSM